MSYKCIVLLFLWQQQHITQCPNPNEFWGFKFLHYLLSTMYNFRAPLFKENHQFLAAAFEANMCHQIIHFWL